MKGCIHRIEAFDIAVPLSQTIKLGAIEIRQREYVVVRVSDERGTVGTAIGLSRNAPVAATVMRTIAPHLKRGSFDEYQQLYDRAVSANVCLGTNGIFWRALSLTDCAVHDLLGRLVDLPVGELLGGQMRPVPCILVGGYPLLNETQQSLRMAIQTMFEAGSSGIKIGSSGNLDKDTARLRWCREEITDGSPLMIDFYWQFHSVEKLCRYAARWKEFKIGWIEDPVRFDDYQAVSTLTKSVPFPVAIGDEQTGLLNFERLADLGHIGVARLDATVCGGITAFRSIAAAMTLRGIPISCHIFPEMHSQLAALEPGVEWLEMFPRDNGLDSMHMLLHSQPRIENGCYLPPMYPGLGYAWNEEALLHYRVT